jgi:hypothetical protein
MVNEERKKQMKNDCTNPQPSTHNALRLLIRVITLRVTQLITVKADGQMAGETIDPSCVQFNMACCHIDARSIIVYYILIDAIRPIDA